METRRAILLVGHGSRREEANLQTGEVAALLQQHRPDWVVLAAHLELTEPSLPEGIDRCVAAGASEVVVQPFLLSPGRHSTRDIPAQVNEARRRHPAVCFRIGEVLGIDDKLVELLLLRIESATVLAE